MGKKQTQFRFEENFLDKINKIAADEGITVSEIVRSALSLYATLYNRTKEDEVKFFIEYANTSKPKCEVILPWIHSK
jgi:hypothetical protein